MKKLALLFTFFMIVNHTMSQSKNDTLLKVLDDQFIAFNNKDIDQLVNNVSDDFKWFYITSDTLLLEVSGKENFRKSMESYYKNMNGPLKSSIENYTINTNKISFRELVEFKNKKGEWVTSSAMGIYEIKNNKISRAWYFTD